jgi:hypothetical protein
MDSLAGRLATLPLILAGPILRRVTDQSVTVWVALQQATDVTLEIYSGNGAAGTKLIDVMRSTVAIGRHLHVLAITAPVNLVPGVVYTYNMSFNNVPLLKAITPTAIPNPISYPPYDLPSFSLPPGHHSDLRIIHGSCRMPHGTGPDALSILDELIRTAVQNNPQNPAKRPHQLFLTGDQIYADDVAAVLLMQLMDASNTLLGTDTLGPDGWQAEETLPAGLPAGGSNHKPSDFPALSRTELLGKDGAGFTSADLRSHLMSLGEYLCMYLFAWSDVLWPRPPLLPTASEVVAAAKAQMNISHWPNDDERRLRLAQDAAKIPGDLDDIKVFLKTLPKVRRALANIPTYMIFDDHDVTDDWNMTPSFCNSVYHDDNGLGRRIVQNALVAYALCQLWGNTPEQFEVDASNAPAAGRKLLTALNKTTSSDYDSHSVSPQTIPGSVSLPTIVGVHKASELKARTPEGNFHDPPNWLTIGGVQVSATSLVYNFTYEGPAHQVIFTDTRSWRSYPHGDNATADLLPPDQMDAQIPLKPATGDRLLMVVLTTNAPPVQPIRGATRHDTLTTVLSNIVTNDSHPDLFEAWEIPSVSFDRLVKRLTDKLTVDDSGAHYGQVLLLSGDVHTSFASRLVYRATNRFGDIHPTAASAVFAQLIASSFKKQTDDTVGFQRDGYFYVPFFLARGLINKDMTEGYVGWNVQGSALNGVGFREVTVTSSSRVGFVHGVDRIRAITKDAPTIQVYPLDTIHIKHVKVDAINLTQRPDYRYRLDYLVPSAQSSAPVPASPIPPMPGPGATPEKRKAAMQTINAAADSYRAHNSGAGTQNIIGRNNISEITLDWGKRVGNVDFKKVNHTVRWRYTPWNPGESTPDPDFNGTYVMWTTYTVNLDPNEKMLYGDLTATVEPP